MALVDPELTYQLPPAVTASTGLDALTQLIEPYVSNRANPLTDAICLEGIRRAARSLRPAFVHAQHPVGEGVRPSLEFVAAREDMALASLFGGLALANAGLGAVHGFAAPIGGMFHAPHGAVCAALLPHVMKTNVIALRERACNSETLRRHDQVAQILTGNEKATAMDGIAWVRGLCGELQIAPLAAYDLTEKDFPLLVDRATKASSMKANSIVLTSQELREILVQAL